MNLRLHLAPLAGGCAIAAALATPSLAGNEPPGRVIFARGTSLWLTDTRGKTKAVEFATLPGPATDVHIIRSDARGTTLLIGHGDHWYTAPVPPTGQLATPIELPCTTGPARLSPNGLYVLCAGPGGRAQIVRLRDRNVFPRDADISAATLTERGPTRELVSVADGAIVAAPLRNQTQRRQLARVAPIRGFLASPDGSRGVGVYREPPVHPKGAPARDELMAFPLDGSGARRRFIRDGVAIDWSWDSEWLLLQDGSKACITRGLGGQTKCWQGFTAVSISPDGGYALVLGPRGTDLAAAATSAAAAATDEDATTEGDDDHDVDDATVHLPSGPLSLYRARLGGARAEPPVLVETVIDGAALWLPVATSPTAAP